MEEGGVNEGFCLSLGLGVNRNGWPIFCACIIRLLPGVPPAPGWILMGNATRAEVDRAPSPPPITELNGNSLERAERDGGRVLLNILGVVRDITGVVKESFLGAGVVNDVMALLVGGL